jgi:hypothetical protein
MTRLIRWLEGRHVRSTRRSIARDAAALAKFEAELDRKFAAMFKPGNNSAITTKGTR